MSMRVKLRRCAFVLFFLAAVVAVAMWLSYSSGLREPKARGVPISRWLAQTRNGDFYQLSEILAEIGPDAIPHLVKAVERRGTIFDKAWRRFWQSLPGSIQRRLGPPKDVLQIHLAA